jgi:MFS family permease
MADGAPDVPERRSFGVLLTQGTLYSTGLQLANVSVVLPFICAQQGLFWVAGLIYPAYSVGIVVGNSLSPYVVQHARHRKHLLVASTTAAMALLVVLSAAAATTGVFVASAFLATAFLSGLASGISKVAYSEVISSKLPEVRRGDLVLSQGAFGAIAAIITTLLLLPFMAERDPAHSHLNVLWLGSSILGAAAIVAVFIGPVAAARIQERVTFRDIYRQGVETARHQSWFRSYVVIQLVFVPVSLGTSFYSIHASVNHSDTAGSLYVLVISSSAGLIAGSLFWRFVNRALGARGMLVISALLGSTAALICVAIEYLHEWREIFIYGIVFFLATVANQAIFTSTLSWLGAFAPEQHRATLIGFGALLVAVESTLLGAALGAVAQGAAVIGPIITILGLNAIAAAAALYVVPKREQMAH